MKEIKRYDLFQGKMSEGVNGKYTLTHDSVKEICKMQKRIEELEAERDITRCANISGCSYYISVEDNKV